MVMVFVSHSTEDRTFIEREIFGVLHSAGIETWYSRDDIRVTDKWERAILEGLKKCDFFLLVMSPRSAISQWVRTEVHFAMNRLRDRIVPVLIEDCDAVDFHLGLPEIQYVDYRVRDVGAEERLLKAFDVCEPHSAEPAYRARATQVASEACLKPPHAHFHCGPWVPPGFFIGRENHLAEAKHLITTGQSFLIVGHPRAGKTSFCRKLKEDIAQMPDLLAGYLNLQQFSRLSLTTFLEHTILGIIGEMARKLFQIRYSDLWRRHPERARPELADDDRFQSFVDIFRMVRERTHEAERDCDEDPDSESHERKGESLNRHDFEQFCRDLMDIAEEAGRRAFVMFYDEANRMFYDEADREIKKIPVKLLESIAEALMDSGLVGGYVASPAMVGEFRRLAIFGKELQLGPFETFGDMQRLLARYYFDDVSRVGQLPVADDAMDGIWRLSRGEPFLIQLLADRSFRLALSEGTRGVTRQHVDDAHMALRIERPSAFTRE
jgi:hypothetical protein